MRLERAAPDGRTGTAMGGDARERRSDLGTGADAELSAVAALGSAGGTSEPR